MNVDVHPNSVERVPNPVPVEVKNWAPSIKPPYVKNTTVRTVVVDPAAGAGNNYVVIGGYEPTRMRVALIVIDSAVMLTTTQPSKSPDASATTGAGEGAFLPPNATNAPMYEFFGPDAMWLNSLTTITRVTVIKEYC